MLTSRKVRIRTEGTKRAGRYMSHTQASLSIDLDAGRRGVRPDRHVDGVGQVEAALGLHDVGEEREHGPVLLHQGQLDLRLVPLEVLFAHRTAGRVRHAPADGRRPASAAHAQARAVRRSLILAAFPWRSRR